MRSWYQYTFNKQELAGMKFLYMRIGDSTKLYDSLQEHGNSLGIKWDLQELESFRGYHFSAAFAEYDGLLLNLGIADDNITDFRKDFWENFIWKTEENPLVTAMIVPSTKNLGSLTESQITESLSLIRITDRAIELFENSHQVVMDVTQWLVNMTKTVHRKARIEPETNDA